jgi:hypothetical protein
VVTSDPILAPAGFATPAVFKRVYLVSSGDGNVRERVRKLGYIDLIRIENPTTTPAVLGRPRL